ncbi:MAG: signal peptidase I [Eubacteriales bacterium]|nr:signal peptidase I [Eubacteriales bacterium]
MKKTWQTVKKVFTILVAVIAVLVMVFTIISVATFNRNDRNLFGFKAFIVLSDSMSATDFSAGDVVFVKNVDPDTLQEGDIISYTSQNQENYGEVVTHKIRARTTDANGDPGFITYGTTTGTDDELVVTYPFINGKYQFSVAKLGTFFQFLKTVPGYIVCILVPFLVLIGMQALNTVKLFRQYKSEQVAELQAEKAEIAEERKRSEEMMAELLALKAQMAQNASAAAASAPAETESKPDPQ